MTTARKRKKKQQARRRVARGTKVCLKCDKAVQAGSGGAHNWFPGEDDGLSFICRKCWDETLPATGRRPQGRSTMELTTGMAFKVCAHCQTEKEVGEFSRCTNSRDKLQSWCRACQLAADEARRQQIADGTWERKQRPHVRGAARARGCQDVNCPICGATIRHKCKAEDLFKRIRQLTRENGA